MHLATRNTQHEIRNTKYATRNVLPPGCTYRYLGNRKPTGECGPGIHHWKPGKFVGEPWGRHGGSGGTPASGMADGYHPGWIAMVLLGRRMHGGWSCGGRQLRHRTDRRRAFFAFPAGDAIGHVGHARSLWVARRHADSPHPTTDHRTCASFCRRTADAFGAERHPKRTHAANGPNTGTIGLNDA